MKKFTKFLLLFNTMATLTAGVHAQKACNLGLTLVSPANNQNIPFTVESNEASKVYLKFNIKNNGSAAIVPTDTIYYMSEFSGTLRFVTGKSIAANATVLIEPGIYINNTATADETRDYCLRLFPQSNVYISATATDTVWAGVTYTDSDTTNNRGCSSINLKKQGSVSIFDITGSSKEALSLYPNPANTELMFNMQLDKAENVSVSVKDITGRVVMSNDFGKVQAGNNAPFKLNVAQLTAGIYFVELNAGDRRAVGKVTIRH